MEKFTLGVEEEYMVIDPVTRELKSHDQKIVEIASKVLGDHVKDEMHQAARSNLIFGLHVHVGIADKNMAIHIMNTVRYFLPHVFAISTNSPFWEGRNTGFKSFRTKVFDKFPRTGIPDGFNDWDDFKNYVNILIKTSCIDNAKKIW